LPERLELDLARQVQQLLLPKSSPVCTWCCIGIRNRMAQGLGGDYFDFITMPDRCQSLFIGDVTGHGLYASVVMSLIYGFIHRAALGACDPLDLVRQVNHFLVSFARRSETIDQYFSSTLFYGIIDPATLHMVYVNAGHVPVLVNRNGTVFELNPSGRPVGFFEESDAVLESFAFERGDRLLLYTDGIIEATDGAGEPFGMDRLKMVLTGAADCDYQELLDRLFDELASFGAVDPPRDDCTAIVLDLHGHNP
jgi:serine phosphatase RsbU (regulator of sigma subunit)